VLKTRGEMGLKAYYRHLRQLRDRYSLIRLPDEQEWTYNSLIQ
jgi:hypothetical protein